ncbi:hypothetical protein L345_16541, partial [Ophiophagus hannah]
MKKSPCVLETDDGLGEDANAAPKGAAGKEHGQPPLETPFQKEAPPSPQIRVNLNYRPGLVTPDDPNRFDRDRLFQAVVAGDPEQLNGLSDYLRRTSSFLTDTKYRDGQNPTIPELLRIDEETGNPEPLVNTACTDSYYKGHTALHTAIEKRNLDLVKILVENKADVHILKHILHREMKDPKFQHLSRKFTEWTYGPIHISLYDLTSIDSCEENSVLEILAYSSNTPVSVMERHR